MKKLIALLLAVITILSCTAAIGENDWNVIDRDEKRGIKLQKVGLNEAEEGCSPTTGLLLEDYDLPEDFTGLAVTGEYSPMLVQIDNSNGGVDVTAPWNASYADIVYETPLYKQGFTRISYLFSDVLPTSAGPVRSARVGHVWLREEWDAGFCYYGGQTRKGSNIKDEFQKYGASKKGVLFSGTDGANKPWKQYYTVVKDGVHKAPGNKSANVSAMATLIPGDHTYPNHAFRFTDDIPEGDTAEEIKINWGAIHYGSLFTYDADSNLYFRYMRYEDDNLIPYEDFATQEQLAFANVIIQHTTVKYNKSSDAPITTHVGEGNADFFMGGVHISGYWKRQDMTSRTIFYGPDGNEIELQRGKTFICMLPAPQDKKDVKEVSYR